jgi:MOSC domain-containing protein YiiM
MTGRVVQVNVSPGGVPKRPVAGAAVSTLGLEGDAHRDREHHGGPERAVCLYALEAIDALRAEGHPIAPGSIGENLTVEGLSWEDVVPGAVLEIGQDLVLEVTRYTSPCLNIARAFQGGHFARVSQKRHPGWSRVYARVCTPGYVRSGDPVRLATAQPGPPTSSAASAASSNPTRS